MYICTGPGEVQATSPWHIPDHDPTARSVSTSTTPTTSIRPTTTIGLLALRFVCLLLVPDLLQGSLQTPPSKISQILQNYFENLTRDLV